MNMHRVFAIHPDGKGVCTIEYGGKGGIEKKKTGKKKYTGFSINMGTHLPACR